MIYFHRLLANIFHHVTAVRIFTNYNVPNKVDKSITKPFRTIVLIIIMINYNTCIAMKSNNIVVGDGKSLGTYYTY